MNTLELRDYYANLLILQYIGKPKAYATIQAQATPAIMPQTSVQVIGFDTAPSSGAYVLSYGGVSTASINWNDSASTIQGKLQAVTGLGSVTVTVSGSAITVTFTGVTPPADLLVVVSSSLDANIAITETDVTLPVAVQNGFNVTGSSYARGVQLDVIGKYAGVTRSGSGFTGQITLDDSDFISLIQMAISQNSAGSSLADIQGFIHQYFPDEMLVFDYQNMQMSYLISSSVGSQDLIQLFVTEGVLPRPMAVQIALIIYAPVINMFFGFRTYLLPAFNSTPFNNYTSYHMDWPWVSYSDAIIV